MKDLAFFKKRLEEYEDMTGVNSIELMASIKENGHAIRLVYQRGQLIRATTRGRKKKGRDITRHMSYVVPTYVSQWEDIDILEVRGEALVSLSSFEVVKNYLKTPLSAVTSILRDSAEEHEFDLLSCICYKIICKDELYETLEDELLELEECGFEVPLRVKVNGANSRNIEKIANKLLDHFASKIDAEDYDYYTDGIVLTVNDNSTFAGFGTEGNYNLGNLALKMGQWESSIYLSVIEDILWVPGKKYITPKAVIRPVATSSGAVVTTVPLYNVGVMERYGLVPGSEIYFKFGGETGVTLTDSFGMSIRQKG